MDNPITSKSSSLFSSARTIVLGIVFPSFVGWLTGKLANYLNLESTWSTVMMFVAGAIAFTPLVLSLRRGSSKQVEHDTKID